MDAILNRYIADAKSAAATATETSEKFITALPRRRFASAT